MISKVQPNWHPEYTFIFHLVQVYFFNFRVSRSQVNQINAEHGFIMVMNVLKGWNSTRLPNGNHAKLERKGLFWISSGPLLSGMRQCNNLVKKICLLYFGYLTYSSAPVMHSKRCSSMTGKWWKVSSVPNVFKGIQTRQKCNPWQWWKSVKKMLFFSILAWETHICRRSLWCFTSNEPGPNHLQAP